jgi:DNA-directed RNA polymerase specialized sigma24 family protein
MVSGEREQAGDDPESSKAGGAVLPEPLTRRGYKRRRPVEQRIIGALSLEGDSFLELVEQRDETSSDYFPPEALIYFIRRANRVGNKRLVNTMMQELYVRCRPLVLGRVRSFVKETRKEIIQEVLTKIASDLLDPGDVADFAEVSFWLYLKRLTIDVVRQRVSELNSPEVSVDGRLSDDDERSELIANIPASSLSLDQIVQLNEGLALLPPKQRQAFIMRHAYDMKIESKNPDEMTLSRHFGVTEKTIRNWLDEAERLLTPFREDRNE